MTRYEAENVDGTRRVLADGYEFARTLGMTAQVFGDVHVQRTVEDVDPLTEVLVIRHPATLLLRAVDPYTPVGIKAAHRKVADLYQRNAAFHARAHRAVALGVHEPLARPSEKMLSAAMWALYLADVPPSNVAEGRL